MLKYRQATDNDLEKLLMLIEAGFSVQNNSFNRLEGWEHRVLFSYLYSLNHSDLNRVRLIYDGDDLIAAVGFFPRQLFLENVKIPVWAISPVVTHPNYRGRGVAGNCLTDVLTELKQQGIPAVFLWGIPDFYPRFGFVPILPRYKTRLSKEKFKEWRSISDGGLRNCTAEDLTALSNLYNKGNHTYWLQPERSLAWWQARYAEMDIDSAYIKEVPFPKKENFMVWENSLQKVSGYLYFERNPGNKRLVVSEGTADNPESAAAMIRTFAMEYLQPDWTLDIRGTPVHVLNTVAYRLGGTHLNPAPLAGMIKVIDWACFLHCLKPLWNERLGDYDTSFDLPPFITNDFTIRWAPNPAGFQLELGNIHHSTDLTVDEMKLTRLFFGHYAQAEGFDFTNRQLKMLFPLKYPFIWDANYLY